MLCVWVVITLPLPVGNRGPVDGCSEDLFLNNLFHPVCSPGAAPQDGHLHGRRVQHKPGPGHRAGAWHQTAPWGLWVNSIQNIISQSSPNAYTCYKYSAMYVIYCTHTQIDKKNGKKIQEKVSSGCLYVAEIGVIYPALSFSMPSNFSSININVYN